ncbi:hypothetical protein LF1_34060 [Rubripirellula obstinata]|uniref:Uncharacterized protein n=1 Tax=Rubripirellula obstinata TaxID=406547 RepID=A0A5B1CNL8_9BACT|nr:hypothetical protein LF1_34060 [Rubripirellula obstinata]
MSAVRQTWEILLAIRKLERDEICERGGNICQSTVGGASESKLKRSTVESSSGCPSVCDPHRSRSSFSRLQSIGLPGQLEMIVGRIDQSYEARVWLV